MSHPALKIATIVSAALLAGCTAPSEQKKDSQSLMEASRQELATAVAERDELLALVKDLSASMEQIRLMEQKIAISQSHPCESIPSGSLMLSDMAAIHRTLRQRRLQLAAMESRFQESSLYTAELQSAVEALRRQIDSQYGEVAHMQALLLTANERIDSLNNTVDSLSIAVESASSEREAARAASKILANELNTCYFVAAPKASLKQHKVIETGFLRKTKLMEGDFDRAFFTTADKRTLEAIPLGHHKTHLYTNHPAGTYTIISGNDSTPSIFRILDPDRFWSLSNYLVIETD